MLALDAVKAMLLCAGLGTRLRPLTAERPKPLVPLLGRPLAAYALDALAHAGARDVVANTFHLGEQIDSGLRPSAESHGMTLATIHEQKLLGTGGGIRNAREQLQGELFVVFNGDVLADVDIAAAVSLHRESGARMTMILREDPRAEALGAIEVDSGGRVRRILGEGPPSDVPVKKCMFTGIYVLSGDVFDELPVEGCIVRHTLRRWMARGERVSAVIDSGLWFDLGTIAQYAAVTFGLLDGSLSLRGIPAIDRSVSVASDVHIASSVTLATHVRLERDCVVEGEGDVSHVIAWEGAHVRAPLRRSIVTSAGVHAALDAVV
ncbi:MAG: sugar phosphate nucleotidyltransferase [Deltaproteobacteria bacterium]|nr:sugar phosphate nucleotidyltransferase [Deltaproteobacteria bacterium]